MTSFPCTYNPRYLIDSRAPIFFSFLIVKLCFICSIFSDAMDWQSMPTNSDEIVVYPVRGGHQSGSSQIKAKNIVDSTWDKSFQWGNLVATHFKGQYFAYALKGNLLLIKYFLTATDHFFVIVQFRANLKVWYESSGMATQTESY